MFQILRTAIVAAVAWLASAVTTYELAVWLRPPRTSDGHPVMPIGLLLWAGSVATVVAGLVVALAIRRARIVATITREPLIDTSEPLRTGVDKLFKALSIAGADQSLAEMHEQLTSAPRLPRPSGSSP